MRLHVGILRTKELLGPLDGQCLHLIHEFAAAIVALARVAFGVLVGQHAALGLKHRLAHNIFRSDKLELRALASQLIIELGGDFRIGFLQCFHKTHRENLLKKTDECGHLLIFYWE